MHLRWLENAVPFNPALAIDSVVVGHLQKLFLKQIIMKKLLFVAVISFVSVYNVRAQGKLAEKQKLIQKVIIDLFQAFSDRDTDKLKSICTPDIIVLENGIIWNLDTLTQKNDQNKSITDFNRINTIDFIDTKVRNNMAWTTYNNQAEVTKNGQHILIKWLETAVLIKEGKIWKIEVLHSTLIKRSSL